LPLNFSSDSKLLSSYPQKRKLKETDKNALRPSLKDAIISMFDFITNGGEIDASKEGAEKGVAEDFMLQNKYVEIKSLGNELGDQKLLDNKPLLKKLKTKKSEA